MKYRSRESRMAWRSLWFAAVALSVRGTAVEGQRTKDLVPPERPLMLEISAGTQLLDFGWEDAKSGRVLAASAAMRWVPPGSMAGLRVTAWWIQRNDAARHGYPLSTNAMHRVLGVAISGDMHRRLGANVSIAPSLGLGLAPSVHSTDDTFQPSGGSATSSGSLWTLGLAVRAGPVVIEQHLIGLLGAERAIPWSREYFPLTLGIRF